MMQTDEVNRASSRHWLYGFNVAVLVAVALVIMGFVLYMTSKFAWHHDVTSGQVHSLSESTAKLLGEIDRKGTKFELVNLSGPGTTNWQDVRDVLQEYGQKSQHVTVKDASETSLKDLSATIRERYADELKPYEETIGEFDKLAGELTKFYKAEGASIGALAQKPGMKEELVQEMAQFQGLFGVRQPEGLAQRQKEVRRTTEADSPDWGKAVTLVKSTVETLEKQLTFFTDPAQMKESLDPVLAKHFAEQKQQYTALRDKVRAYKEKLDKLPPLKVQEVLDGLAQNPLVVVIGPSSAKVLGRSDMYKFQRNTEPGREGPTESFEGEQAISSSLLSIVRPEKVKVVFVTSSPRMGSTGQHSDIADRLREANFEVLDWSPPARPMGQESPESASPPASGKGVVWVVFPPEQPNPQMMMMGMPPPNPKPLVDAVRAHMAAGGQAMFLAEAATGPAGMMGGGTYPFAEQLKPFGVEVKSNLAVIQAVEQGGKRLPNPAVEVERYPETQITHPLDSLSTMLAPLSGQSGMVGVPTVVAVSKPVPAGVSAAVLAQTPNQSDYFGTANLSGEAKFDPGTDYAAPVPLAVAASRQVIVDGKPAMVDGKPVEQRVVVVGATYFGSNPFLEQPRYVQLGERIIGVSRFPGNAELFVNSVLWLAGYENMIAVSSKAGVALRIKDMSPAELWGIRWGVLWAGGPLGALVLGALVWFVRRR